MIKNYMAIVLSLAYIAYSVWRIKNKNMTPRGWFLMICFSLFLVFISIMTIKGVPLSHIR